VRAWPTDDPLRTLHTTASKALACPPFLAVHRGGPNEARTRELGDPAPTLAASGNHLALLVPVEGREGKHAHPAAVPARTQTARNETGLLVPAGGTWNDDARPVAEPMRTRTTRETEALVIAPVVVPMRNHNRAKQVTEPFDAFAAHGLHHALLVRNNSSRGGGAEMSTPTTEPMRTLTTTGHQSLVWNPNLLLAYDTGTLRSVGSPLPTQTTVEGDALLESGIVVEDCLFRMLMPDEIKLGMAFAPDFVLLGSKREQVKLAGNAVTPPAARDLIAAVVEVITGDEVIAA
jgi:DNA (cytosine-5)-methyltransferase 1